MRVVLWLAVFFGPWSLTVLADVSLEIHSGNVDRANSLLIVEQPDECKNWKAISASCNGESIPIQRIDAPSGIAPSGIAPSGIAPSVGATLNAGKIAAGTSEPVKLALLVKALAKFQKATIHLHEQQANSPPNVTVTDDGKRLVAKVGDKIVFGYNHAVVEPSAGVPPYYARSGHIHPLRSPAGKIVTDDFSPDHIHQHGIMFAWTNCTFEGRDVNFWEQQREQSVVRHVKTLDVSSGNVFGQFRVQILHQDITSGTPKDVLLDTWTVRIHNIKNYFVFDIDSLQTCVADAPLTIRKYHYGGMAIRGARSWQKESDMQFTTNEAKDRIEGNHSRPNWCDIRGKLDGELAGVSLLDHPSNFRFPQPVRLHPTMPYFCFAPLVLGEFEIEPRSELRSRYRFVVTDGAIDSDTVDRIWHDYANPIQLTSDDR